MSKIVNKKNPAGFNEKLKTAKNNESTPNLFEKFLAGKKGLFGCLFILILLSFFVFKDYILLHNVFLFKDIASDSVNASYPQFLNISNYLRTDGFPKWSFNNGMGQNIFSFILRDPSDILVYLLGKDNLSFGIIFKELIKIILGGFVFFLFLRRLSLTIFTSLIGAMLFSFSGFMILGSSGWYVFTFEALTLALLLLSFEKLFQVNSWTLFPISIALIGISMPFNLYVYGLFLLIYALFRFLFEKGWEPKALFNLLLKMSLLTLLGLGISSMFLFSNILQLLESPRIGGDASYFSTLSKFPIFGFSDLVNYFTTIMRSFSADLIGTGINFKGWGNYLEAPLFYCGLITLLLVPQVFGFLNKKQKILYSVFIGLWIIPIIFPFFRYTFWLFTGDYYRAFSLCIATAFMFLGLNALNYIDKMGKVNLIVLIVSLIILFAFLFYPYLPQSGPVDKSLRFTVRNFLLIYAILIYLLSFKKAKLFIQYAILLTLFIELAYMSSITVNKRSVISAKELKDKVGYNDYTNEAVAYLNSIDKSFFRIDKNYSSGPAIHGSLNDPQAQNYKSTPSYYSFNQLYYIKFLQGTNVIHGSVETETRWAQGLINRPLLESLSSVKYILSKLPDNRHLLAGHDSLAQFGNVKIYRNKNYLPLGFTYDKYILASDFHKMSDLQKDISIFKGFVIQDQTQNDFKGFEVFNLNDTLGNYTWDSYGNDVKALRKDSLLVSEYNNNTIKGKINVDNKKLLFFSIPYDKGWQAKIDGKDYKPLMVDFGLMGLMLDKGEHSIELKYEVPFLNLGITVSVVSLMIFFFLIWRRSASEKMPLSDL